MLLIEEENKRVVMVRGAEGQERPHGPFDTEDEACYYLDVCIKHLHEVSKVVGYKVIELQVVSLCYLSGMV